MEIGYLITRSDNQKQCILNRYGLSVYYIDIVNNMM